MKTVGLLLIWTCWVWIGLCGWGCDSSGSTGSLSGDGDPVIDAPAESSDEVAGEEEQAEEVEEDAATEDEQEIPPADLDEEPMIEEEEEIPAEIEEEWEEEAEEEIEEEVRVCTSRTEPFELMTEVAYPRFRESGWEHFGEITENCQTDGFLIAGAEGMVVEIRLEPRDTAAQSASRADHVHGCGGGFGEETARVALRQHLPGRSRRERHDHFLSDGSAVFRGISIDGVRSGLRNHRALSALRRLRGKLRPTLHPFPGGARAWDGGL